MQISISLSNLANMQLITAGLNTIQLPNVVQSNIMQMVSMRSGDTLVLSGSDKLHNTYNEQGVISPQNWLFGGSANSQKKREKR